MNGMSKALLAMVIVPSFASLAIGCGRAPAIVDRPKSVVLSNAVTIVAVEIPKSTNVSVFSFVPMGLATDEAGRTQWAHLIEHLTLRATTPEDAVDANAETLADHMRFDFYGAVSNWKDGLSLQRQWLQRPSFSEKTLREEKPKVNSEVDYTVRNLYTHKFALAAWGQAARLNQKAIAVRGDIDRATLGEAQKYRDEHFGPVEKIVVCVVGGVMAEEVFAACSNAFGGLSWPHRAIEAVPVNRGEIDAKWELSVNHLVMTWPIPAAQEAEFAALQVGQRWINMQLAADPKLQNMTGMAAVGTDLRTPEGNWFYVSASLRPGHSFELVQGTLLKIVEKLTDAKSQLANVKALARNEMEALKSLPNIDAIKAQAPANLTAPMIEANVGLQWGTAEYRFGSARQSLIENLGKVTPESVRAAAEKFLTATNRTTVRLRAE